MRSIHVSTSGEVFSSDSEENNQILEGGNASCSFGDDRRTDNASTESADREILREQDRFLPIANVARLMKRGVPETGKIAKDAKECCQESVSEFISFLTSEAAERSLIEKRKTINGEDLLVALDGLGFEPYVEYMRGYLEKYRVACKTEKNTIDNIAPFVVRQKPTVTHIANIAPAGSNPAAAKSPNQRAPGTSQITLVTQPTNTSPTLMYLEAVPSSGDHEGGTNAQPSQYVTLNAPQAFQFLQLHSLGQQGHSGLLQGQPVIAIPATTVPADTADKLK